MIALLGLFGGAWSKLATYAVAIGAALAAAVGFAAVERRVGERKVEAADVQREADDARTAAGIADQVAHESDAQVLADLQAERKQ